MTEITTGINLILVTELSSGKTWKIPPAWNDVKEKNCKFFEEFLTFLTEIMIDGGEYTEAFVDIWIKSEKLESWGADVNETEESGHWMKIWKYHECLLWLHWENYEN